MANIVVLVGDVNAGPAGQYTISTTLLIESGPKLGFFVSVPFTDSAAQANNKIVDAAIAEANTAGFPVSGGDKKLLYSPAS